MTKDEFIAKMDKLDTEIKELKEQGGLTQLDKDKYNNEIAELKTSVATLKTGKAGKSGAKKSFLDVLFGDE